MAFTLAKPSARSNSDCPSARPRPAANPVPELARTVAMHHPGRRRRPRATDGAPPGPEMEARAPPPARAMAVAGLLPPAERQVGFGADGGGVHVRDAAVELAHRPEGGVHVPRVERAREPVLHVVVHADGLVERAHPDHGEHRAKDLFLLRPHPGPYPGQHGGFVEPPALEPLP